MSTVMANQETPAFPLSLAILNSDIHSPVLFLHLKVDIEQKKITGNCELIKPKAAGSLRFKTELDGSYKFLNIIPEGTQHLVNLLGFPLYDQFCPTIKITLITDAEWKKGKVFYEYLENGQWLKVQDVYLKIKLDQNSNVNVK